MQRGQFFQDRLIGTRPCFRFSLYGQAEFAEKNFPELFRRIRVERMPRHLFQFGQQLFNSLCRRFALPMQFFCINSDPVQLHLSQYRNQWLFDFLEQIPEFFLTEAIPYQFAKLQGDIRIFAGVLCNPGDVNFKHLLLRFSFSDQVGNRNHLMPEILTSNRIQAVTPCPGVQKIMPDHGIHAHGRVFDSVTSPHQQIVFDVLVADRNILIFHHRPKRRNHFPGVEFLLAFRPVNGNVIGSSRLITDSPTDDLRPHRIDRSRLQIDTDFLLFEQFFNQFIQGIGLVDDEPFSIIHRANGCFGCRALSLLTG